MATCIESMASGVSQVNLRPWKTSSINEMLDKVSRNRTIPRPKSKNGEGPPVNEPDKSADNLALISD